jgi:hypothetical protein
MGSVRNSLFNNFPLCSPFPKAMPRVETGHATYFWVDPIFKSDDLKYRSLSPLKKNQGVFICHSEEEKIKFVAPI